MDEAQSFEDIIGLQEPDNALLKWALFRNLDRAQLIEDYATLIEVAKLPAHNRQSAAIKFMEEVGKRGEFGNRYSKAVVPMLARALVAEIRTIAIHRTAEAGVALARCRTETGAFPTTLSELVPTYLSAIPADPFTGEPLRYRRNSGRVVVYSVADDGDDDGGSDPDDAPLSEDGDVFFECVVRTP